MLGIEAHVIVSRPWRISSGPTFSVGPVIQPPHTGVFLFSACCRLS